MLDPRQEVAKEMFIVAIGSGNSNAVGTLYYNGELLLADPLRKASLRAFMSYLVTPFDVSSQALGGNVHCRFVHLLSGIATRHSDTIDCVFLQDGKRVLVAISCAELSKISESKYLTDQQLAEVAALHLRRTLEQGYDAAASELHLGGEQLRHLARELGFL